MSRTEDRSLANRLGDLEALADRLEVVHVQTELVIIGRAEPWAPPKTVAEIEQLIHHEPVDHETGELLTAEVLERRRDLDLLLDPQTGTRRLRHLVDDVEEFDRIAELAKTVKIAITLHLGQLGAYLSTAAIIALLGGNQSGKTRTGLYWLIRQWILRGHAASPEGPAATFWILAPSLPKAWKRLVKDFAPLVPRDLRAGSLPRSARAELVLTMIDGCRIEALHAAGDGDNLKSERVSGILFDEAGAAPDPGNWQQVNSRSVRTGAKVFVATTPKAGHWAYEKIVLQEPHSGGRIAVFHVDLFHNPWLTTPRVWSLLLGDSTLTQAELEERILSSPDPAAACRAIVESPRALREHFGIWTADGIRLWSEWTLEVARSCTRAGQATWHDSLTTELGELIPVTEQAAEGFMPWSGLGLEQTRIVGGQDFNVAPQTTILAQVFGRPEDPSTWTLFVVDEIQTEGTVELHGERLSRSWPGLPIACDPAGDIPRLEQQSGEGDEAARLRDMGFACHSCVGRGRRLVSQKPTLNLLHYLMRRRRLIVHVRCTQLLKALQTQQAKPDGRIDKRSGTRSPTDRRSSPTDALRYLAWALLRHELEDQPSWQ